MRDAEEQRTDHDGGGGGHTPAQTRKDEAAKEYFFTEGRDKDGGEERGVGGNGGLFAAGQEHLVVGLQVEMEVRDDGGVEEVHGKNCQNEQYNQGGGAADGDSAEAERVEYEPRVWLDVSK